MDYYRLWHTFHLHLLMTGADRANYIRDHHLFRHCGDHCMFMFRKLPLYSELISVGDNVHIASNVTFITHDVTHNMLSHKDKSLNLSEYIGCIEIGDNVFVGANTTILYNSKIPSDTIIGANSLINHKLEIGGVYAGMPAKYICSLDEFLNKRLDYNLHIEKNKTRLTQKTVNEAWQVFYDK